MIINLIDKFKPDKTKNPIVNKNSNTTSSLFISTNHVDDNRIYWYFDGICYTENGITYTENKTTNQIEIEWNYSTKSN